MQSSIVRKRYPSKTIVVKKNNPLFQSADQGGEKKQKVQRSHKITRRKGNMLDNQDFHQLNKFQLHQKKESESDSDSDASRKKSILSESSSESSIASSKTLKSKSSKRQKATVKDLTQDLIQHYQSMLRKTESGRSQQKQEEMKEKMFNHIAYKATAHDYMMRQQSEKQDQFHKNQSQYQSREGSSEHLSELFSDMSNDDQHSENSNISLELINNKSLTPKREHIPSDDSREYDFATIPIVEMSSTYVKPRISNFQSSIAGFSHLSVTELSQSSNEIENDQLKKLQNQFGKIYSKLSFVGGAAHIKFKKMSGFKKYTMIYENSYIDDNPMLQFRKAFVLAYLCIKRISKIIIRSRIYQYILTFVTISNITIFIYQHIAQDKITLLTVNYFFLWCYAIDLILQLLSFGLFRTKFIFLARIAEIILLILYYYHLLYPNEVFNITPFRMVRFLKLLGAIFEGLQNMIEALIESLKFIFESTAIVILFVLFFASLGTSLFMGLFNERCLPSDEADWVQCVQGTCPSGQTCVMTNEAYNIPTNFNNIIYSFGIMLKTVTMDDWSFVMYYTIRAFHPIVWIYYVLIIFVGGFFGFNMPIAVFKTHYSEIQQRTCQVIDEREQIISKSQLKKINFYYYIQQMNIFLFSNKKEITFNEPRLSRTQQNWDMAPRPLLGSVINQNKKFDSKFTNLKNQIRRFSIKFLLLPKLTQVQNFFRNLDTKSMINEEKYQIIIRSFNKSSFLLEKFVDFQYSYMPTSQLDVLRSQLFQVFKDTENKQFRFDKKKKFFYKPIQVKSKLINGNNQRTSRSDLTAFTSQISDHHKLHLPIKSSQRVKKENLNSSDLHVSKSSSDSASLNLGYTQIRESDKERRKFPYFIKEMPVPLESERKPFASEQDGQLKLLINGVYQDYQSVSKRINAAMKCNKSQPLKIQEEYAQIRRKELQKKIIRIKNWSGNNVLISSISLIQKFDDIFHSLNERDIEIYQTSLSGILQNLRKYAFKIIHFNLTKFFFDLTILINTTFLALQGIIERSIIDRVEDIATVLLSIEIFLSLIVYKPKRIAKNKHHVFELLIIILSLIEFSLSSYLNVSEQYLRLMRSTKCLLFYRCISYISMARIIGAIAQLTYKSYIYLTFLMFFTILSFGLIGMELYANKFTEYQKQGYLQSFDDPIKAFMTVFNIMTNDDWYGVYRIGTEVTLDLSIAYSISLVFTLNYFIFGIMMAIVLDGFSQYLERESSNEENEFMKEKIKQINKLNKQLESDTDQDSESGSSSNSSSSSIKQYKELANHYTFNNNKIQLRRESTTPENFLICSGNLKDQASTRREANNNNNFNEKLFHSLQFPSNRQRRCDPVTDLKRKIKEDLSNLKNKTNININKLKGQDQKCIKLVQENIEQMERQILKQNPKLYTGNDCLQSLYIFHKSSNFRKLMYKISASITFKYFIDAVLILSIIYLSLPEEIQEQPEFVTLLFVLNTIIIVEFIIKIIAYGVFMDRGAYLNYTWKTVDLIYIIIYYISFFKIGYLPIFKVIHTFLYFRPLKLLYRIKWVVRVRAALTQSLFDIINVFVVLILVWLMFAVFSIMLYTDKMGYCEELINYDLGRNQCEQEGKNWIVFKHNFDNITTAMPALFVISTFDGWGSILWVSQNSREAYYGPHLYFSQAPTYIFYIAFCMVGAMFFLQLFTGVLFINLKANSKQMENSQLTQAQQEFKKVAEIILFDHPIKSTLPKSIIKRYLTSFITNSYVDYSMFTLLIINCIAIMMIQHDEQDSYNTITNQIHHICTIVFAFWLLCQAIAFGINRYKDNPWRLYSTFVILLGLIDFVIDLKTNWFIQYLHSTQLTQNYQLLRFLCMLRNLRIIIIFQGLINLQRLIRVMSFAFPFLLKILFILLIIMIVFAFYGMMLFGDIDKGSVLDDMINFKNFWLAMLTLFKCASGDDFRSIMNDCMQHNPYCQEDPKYCGSPYAQIYFILFMLISNNVLLNLFVLSMIEQFELFFNNQDSILQTYIENIDNFRKVWFKYSCQNGQFLNIKALPYLLLEIKEPLGCSQYENIWDAAKNCLQFNLKCDEEDNISYNQLLYEIFFNRYQKQIFGQCPDIATQKMKNFHKIMTFRLSYYRRGIPFRRNNIGPQLKLKGNSNPLYYQIIALITFKIWKSYTQQMISNILIEQQYISERSFRDTEPMRHSISQRSLESLESNIKLNDKPIYQKRRLGRLKRVSLQGQLNDYLPGDIINPKPVLKRKSSFGINVEEGVTQSVYESGRVQRKQ